MQKSCENLHSQINDLQNEKIILQNKCDSSHKSLLKLAKGRKNVDKLLGSQCVFFNKEGLEFKSYDQKRSYKHLFIKEPSQKEFQSSPGSKNSNIDHNHQSSTIYQVESWVP